MTIFSHKSASATYPLKSKTMPLTCICLLVIFLLALLDQDRAAAKMIIAQSGAGKNLIEHTLPAVTLAAAMGVDYFELHVVITADDQLVVFHDLTLDRLTDVAAVFPDRKREDGAYYVIDFTLDEIRRLRLQRSTKANEFPLALGIPTLSEELGLLRRLEIILNRQLGVVLEIRQPWFHLHAGKDISTAALNTLAQFHYTTAESKLYLQCFDPDELQRIHNQLMPERQMNLPLIQLFGENNGQETQQENFGQWEPYNFDWLLTNTGLRMVASYAAAIALPTKFLVDRDGNLPLAGYIGEAHRFGLQVLAFPLTNTSDFPSFAPDFPTLVNYFFSRVDVDGIYTDLFADAQRSLLQYSEKKKEKLPSVKEELPPSKETVPMQQDDLPPFFRNLHLSRPLSPNAVLSEEQEKVLAE
jgi:glycerophosphoryl diester phosphodiesterase